MERIYALELRNKNTLNKIINIRFQSDFHTMPTLHITEVTPSCVGITPTELNKVAPSVQKWNMIQSEERDNCNTGFSGIVDFRENRRV